MLFEKSKIDDFDWQQKYMAKELSDITKEIQKEIDRRENKQELDDLKWRIVMLEEKLKYGEPIIGTVPLGEKTIFFTKDKAFKDKK